MPSRERTKLTMPLTSKWFWKRNYKWDRQNWFSDHIGWIFCKIIGHKEYFTGENDYKACSRCARYLSNPH